MKYDLTILMYYLKSWRIVRTKNWTCNIFCHLALVSVYCDILSILFVTIKCIKYSPKIINNYSFRKVTGAIHFLSTLLVQVYAANINEPFTSDCKTLQSKQFSWAYSLKKRQKKLGQIMSMLVDSFFQNRQSYAKTRFRWNYVVACFQVPKTILTIWWYSNR